MRTGQHIFTQSGSRLILVGMFSFYLVHGANCFGTVFLFFMSLKKYDPQMQADSKNAKTAKP